MENGTDLVEWLEGLNDGMYDKKTTTIMPLEEIMDEDKPKEKKTSEVMHDTETFIIGIKLRED